MKFLVLFLVASCIHAHDITLEAGMLPSTVISQSDKSGFQDTLDLGSEVMYVDLGGHYALPLEYGLSVFVGGDIATYVVRDGKQISFFPFFTQYTFDTGVRWNDVTIGYKHMCEHPDSPLLYATGTPLFVGDAAFDRLYIRFSKEFR